MEYIIRQTDNIYQGIRLLALEDFPSCLINNAFLQEGILRVCSASCMQCELMAIREKDSDILYLFLLLQWSGVSRKELVQRMEQDSCILQKQLVNAGIASSFVEGTDEGVKLFCSLLDCFIRADEGAGQVLSQAFFPHEPEIGQNSLYYPGSWGRFVLNWNEIGTILSNYDAFLFSLRIIPTSFYPAETQIIVKMIRRINDQKTEGIIAKDTRYHDLLQMKDQSVYLVNLWISGEPRLAREIRLYLREKGLSSVIIPPLFFNGTGYVFSGSLKLTNYLNRIGHRKGFSDNRIPSAFQRLTRIVSKDEQNVSFALPDRWNGIKGLRIHELGSQPVLLPKEMRTGNNSVFIGRQEKTGQDVYLPVGDITRHGCIVGKPGSGKTTFALGLLSRLYGQEQSIPFLVIEPAKKEYRTLMECIPNLQVYTPGAADIAPIQMNLFLPPPGVTLEEYLPCVDQIFDMTFSMTSLLKDIFTKVIRTCYTLYGWRDDSTRESKEVRFFGLHEFIREFRRYVRENIYDQESRNNVENSGVMRLQKLLEQNYLMFDTVWSPDYQKMLSVPTVIELDAISDATQRSLVMAVIIVNLMALIRKRTDFSGNIQNLILIDEAHLILDPEDHQKDADAALPGRAALKMLQNMTLILRAYGTALLFGDQSPSRLTKEILGNVNMKMMFRLDDPEDRAILGQSALLDQEMQKEMVLLNPGQGFLSCSRTNVPILLQTPDVEKEMNLKKNISDMRVKAQMKSDLPMPFAQCERCDFCKGRCRVEIRKEARQLAQRVIRLSKQIREILLADPGKSREMRVALQQYFQNDLMEEIQTIGKPRLPWTNQLAACTKIHMIRELLIQGNGEMNEEDFMETKMNDIGRNKKKSVLSQYRN